MRELTARFLQLTIMAMLSIAGCGVEGEIDDGEIDDTRADPVAAATGCMAPQNDLFENPFNKSSAQHRPMGTGAIYASDSDPATRDWMRANGRMSLNVGLPFGDFVIEARPAD